MIEDLSHRHHVGGTFTAVLIDNATYDVVGRYSVLTTHADERGAGRAVEVFRGNVPDRSKVDPKDVIFPAHSTTQRPMPCSR